MMKGRHHFRRRFSLQPSSLKEGQEDGTAKNVRWVFIRSFIDIYRYVSIRLLVPILFPFTFAILSFLFHLNPSSSAASFFFSSFFFSFSFSFTNFEIKGRKIRALISRGALARRERPEFHFLRIFLLCAVGNKHVCIFLVISIDDYEDEVGETAVIWCIWKPWTKLLSLSLPLQFLSDPCFSLFEGKPHHSGFVGEIRTPLYNARIQ